MENRVNDFYNNTNNEIQQEVSNLDATVSFDQIEFISKNDSQGETKLDTIEILVDMAKTGKIDPWNIDIVDLYDKYMEKLSSLNIKDLKSIGRALLFTSVLLRLKSNIIDGLNLDNIEGQDDFEDGFFDGFEDDYDAQQLQLPSSNVVSFDEVLQRRTSVRLNRNRNVTLKDLIRHIEFYEQLEKKQSLKNALDRQKRRVRDYSKLKASDIKNLAHEEYIEDIVEKMRQNLAQILGREEKIELKELALLGFDRSSAYIAILFLLSKNEIDIEQEEFYGNLYVKKPSEIANEDEEQTISA